MSLTDAERRSIALYWPYTDNGDLACRCGECVRKVESTVEAIVAARVKAAKVEALREAADEMSRRLDGFAESWLRYRADRIGEDR